MIVFALIVAAATLVVGIVAALLLRRVPTLRLQLAGLGLLAVILPLAAVSVSGAVMFSSGHDMVLLFVAASASTAAVVAALVLGRSIVVRIDRLRTASEHLAGGDLIARAARGGPAELDHLAASFNVMAGDLERLFDARRELVAWASHDLRTPLASLQAMLEAVEDGLAAPEAYLPAMREQVRALGRLVDDLFELARIDAGVLTLEIREAELANLVESCLRGLEAEARARGVTLQARLNDSNASVLCAPDKVERVLFNLLTNALRHTPSDGAVAVRVESGTHEVQVTVEDTGEGLPADASSRAFDRFWRGDAARSPGKGGAGLGLAIARGLVEAQGGRIWVENPPEGGARISFTLPAA
ncbi:MAG TPA: HAMP domain-containing sensor histidine kinase [Gaiellaceae bacterium]|nr:HAMP domain-containing sensor histidine kinase [Gaiellaceae bacterium]